MNLHQTSKAGKLHPRARVVVDAFRRCAKWLPAEEEARDRIVAAMQTTGGEEGADLRRQLGELRVRVTARIEREKARRYARLRIEAARPRTPRGTRPTVRRAAARAPRRRARRAARRPAARGPDPDPQPGDPSPDDGAPAIGGVS